jgi:hypothetical protein
VKRARKAMVHVQSVWRRPLAWSVHIKN